MAWYKEDTPISLGRCGKCSAYVFTATVEGMAVTVDPRPLDAQGTRDALIAGRILYDQVEAIGQPRRLIERTPDSKWPSAYTVLASHPCRLASRSVAVAPVKSSARANSSNVGVSDARATHARVATPARIKAGRRYLYRRCEKCDETIGFNRDLIGVFYNDCWEWVQHAECEPHPDPCETCGRIGIPRQKDGTMAKHRDCSGEHWCGDEFE